MSPYEMLRARKLGYSDDFLAYIYAKQFSKAPPIVEHEYTGAVPVTITADGEPLLDYLISGNTFQNGTPTPDNPIMPQGCGERTGNLFDKDNAVIGERVLQNRVITDAGTAHSDYIDVTGISTITVNKKYNATNFYFYADKTSNSIGYVNDFTANVPTGAKYCRINVLKDDVDTIMLNTGSTALPYEPWGIKIPISSASTTTPVYLGEVETTRRVRKLVLDGTEEWRNYGPVPNTYRLSISNIQSIGNPAICSHFVNSPISEIASGKFTVGSTWIYIRYADVADLADFKSYLAQQYANGTPVTLWYVLATPETGIVNEPLMCIGDYADTLSKSQAGVAIPTNNGSTTVDVDTTLKPSEVYIKYKGV